MTLINTLREKFQKKNLDLIFILLLGVVVTFPLEKINPKFIFALFGVQLILTFIRRKHIEFKATPFLWLLIFWYGLNIFGLLYTDNLPRAGNMISRQISLLLFPLFYAVYRVKNITFLFKAYIIAIASFILIFELHTVYRFFYLSDTFPLNLKLFLSYRYTGAELTKLIAMHNTYFAIYVMFANVLIISFLSRVKKKIYIILLLLLVAFQSIFILQMVAKTAIILNTVIVIASLSYFLSKGRRLKTLVFLIALVLGTAWFTTTYFNLPMQRIVDRFVELQEGDRVTKETRYKIWKASIPIIREHILLGVGTGDVEQELHKEYAKRGIASKSNIHNQYLDSLMRFGILGLLTFLVVFGFGFVRAVKTDNYVYFCFLVIIMGCCMTENILSRQWGITFYACFNYLLYLNHPKKEQ
ncbi:O-antigen ligase family protein [Sungkyunkwania multivorans]|uniref:O-antigen ligase family protein n=1 Tax=Sungkyunkwania multivorans TaxID=1173618 RepID=A0ABW3D0Z1_9FLAO